MIALFSPLPPGAPLLGTTGTELLQFGLLIAAGVWTSRRAGADGSRFVGAAFVLVSAFYLLCPESSSFQREAGGFLMRWLAVLQAGMMGLAGTPVGADGISVVGSFRFTYAQGCMGLSYVAMAVLCLLAYPVSWRRKLWGVALVAGGMTWINLLRLMALYHLWELGETRAYAFFHRAGGGCFALAALAVFCGLLWARPRAGAPEAVAFSRPAASPLVGIRPIP
jgi:exosortase/archaeosortase family protein